MSSAGKDTQDRWLLWPYLPFVIYPLVVVTQAAFNQDFEGILPVIVLVFITLGFLVVMPFVAVKHFRAKFKRKGMSTLMLPVFCVLLLLSTQILVHMGDTIYFYRIRDSLQKEVDHVGGKDSNKLLVWVTGGFLSDAHGFAYDGSDEMTLPSGKQSAAWRQRASNSELVDDCFDSEHLTGHYYRFSTDHACRDK